MAVAGRDRHGRHARLRHGHVPGVGLRRGVPGRRLARRLAHDPRAGIPLSGLRLGYGGAGAAAIAFFVTLVAVLPNTAARPDPRSVAEALGDVPDDPVTAARAAAAIAVRTAACLRAAGIRAVPIVDGPISIPDPDLDPVRWAERWGFGVSTSIGAPSPSPAADPNLSAAIGAGPVAHRRYLDALLGVDDQPGCHQVASDEVLGLRRRTIAPLARELSDLQRSIAADKDQAAVEQHWQACVRSVAPTFVPGRGPGAGDIRTIIDAFAKRSAAAA